MNEQWTADEWRDPQVTAVCMGFDAMRVCLGSKPRYFTVPQIEKWIREITMPSYQEIADSLAAMRPGSHQCPLCARAYVHQHTPEELIIYRNGMKYGRSCNE